MYTMWTWLLSLLLLLPLHTNPQCDHYGGCRGDYPFLPSPPGRSPHCAKSGDTYCEKVTHYPSQLIRYLIERWGYDYNTLLSDESRDDYRYSRPPPVQPHYHYHGYNNVPIYYPGPQQPLINMSAGYPDRRYRFEFNYSGPYLYTAVLPSHYTPSAMWWARFARSPSDKSRSRRQTTNQNQLCPTMAQYIMPRAALNNRGNWMYVVNLNEVDDRYTQLVRSERCVSNQCNGLCSIPNGYTSSCQQQFVQKRLVALEGSGDRLYTDIFWFPHCCICQIQQTNG